MPNGNMPQPEMESPAERFDRDWLHVRDDRKERTLDHQAVERLERLYVDRETSSSAVLTSGTDVSE